MTEMNGMWVGSTMGAMRYDPKSGTWRYFNGPRMLAGESVISIAMMSDVEVFVATDTGLSRLYLEEFTLEKKAAIYEGIRAKR